MWGHKHFCVLYIVCELLQPNRKISQTVVRISTAIPLCVFIGVSEGVLHHSRGASPSLRSWAGLVEDKSCDVNVDDELLPELADNPGTPRGTKLSVLHTIVFPSLVNRGF